MFHVTKLHKGLKKYRRGVYEKEDVKTQEDTQSPGPLIRFVITNDAFLK